MFERKKDSLFFLQQNEPEKKRRAPVQRRRSTIDSTFVCPTKSQFGVNARGYICAWRKIQKQGFLIIYQWPGENLIWELNFIRVPWQLAHFIADGAIRLARIIGPTQRIGFSFHLGAKAWGKRSSSMCLLQEGPSSPSLSEIEWSLWSVFLQRAWCLGQQVSIAFHNLFEVKWAL